MQRCAIPLSAIVIVLAAAPATAAVRKCGPTITTEIVSAPTELEAKKKALAQWRAEALKRGQGFDSWRLADGKALKCFPNTSGYDCIALGAPCIVDQTPRTPPKLPGDKGTGI